MILAFLDRHAKLVLLCALAFAVGASYAQHRTFKKMEGIALGALEGWRGCLEEHDPAFPR